MSWQEKGSTARKDRQAQKLSISTIFHCRKKHPTRLMPSRLSSNPLYAALKGLIKLTYHGCIHTVQPVRRPQPLPPPPYASDSRTSATHNINPRPLMVSSNFLPSLLYSGNARLLGRAAPRKKKKSGRRLLFDAKKTHVTRHSSCHVHTCQTGTPRAKPINTPPPRIPKKITDPILMKTKECMKCTIRINA